MVRLNLSIPLSCINILTPPHSSFGMSSTQIPSNTHQDLVPPRSLKWLPGAIPDICQDLRDSEALGKAAVILSAFVSQVPFRFRHNLTSPIGGYYDINYVNMKSKPEDRRDDIDASQEDAAELTRLRGCPGVEMTRNLLNDYMFLSDGLRVIHPQPIPTAPVHTLRDNRLVDPSPLASFTLASIQRATRAAYASLLETRRSSTYPLFPHSPYRSWGVAPSYHSDCHISYITPPSEDGRSGDGNRSIGPLIALLNSLATRPDKLYRLFPFINAYYKYISPHSDALLKMRVDSTEINALGYIINKRSRMVDLGLPSSPTSQGGKENMTTASSTGLDVSHVPIEWGEREGKDMLRVAMKERRRDFGRRRRRRGTDGGQERFPSNADSIYSSDSTTGSSSSSAPSSLSTSSPTTSSSIDPHIGFAAVEDVKAHSLENQPGPTNDTQSNPYDVRQCIGNTYEDDTDGDTSSSNPDVMIEIHRRYRNRNLHHSHQEHQLQQQQQPQGGALEQYGYCQDVNRDPTASNGQLTSYPNDTTFPSHQRGVGSQSLSTPNPHQLSAPFSDIGASLTVSSTTSEPASPHSSPSLPHIGILSSKYPERHHAINQLYELTEDILDGNSSMSNVNYTDSGSKTRDSHHSINNNNNNLVNDGQTSIINTITLSPSMVRPDNSSLSSMSCSTLSTSPSSSLSSLITSTDMLDTMLSGPSGLLPKASRQLADDLLDDASERFVDLYRSHHMSSMNSLPSNYPSSTITGLIALPQAHVPVNRVIRPTSPHEQQCHPHQVPAAPMSVPEGGHGVGDESKAVHDGTSNILHDYIIAAMGGNTAITQITLPHSESESNDSTANASNTPTTSSPTLLQSKLSVLKMGVVRPFAILQCLIIMLFSPLQEVCFSFSFYFSIPTSALISNT